MKKGGLPALIFILSILIILFSPEILGQKFYFNKNTVGINSAVDSLTFIGHASVKIKTAQGKIIYIDPFQTGNYSDSADVVLITHPHSDHNAINLIKRKTNCQTITNANAHQGTTYNNFTIDNIYIEAVPAYNSNHPSGSSVGYIVEFNGIKLYHAGDTGFISEMANLTQRHLDYALLPIDGIYTMTPEQGTIAADTIGAFYSIPFHTMPPPDNFSETIVARFTPDSKLVVHHGETIALISQTTNGLKDAENIPDGYTLYQNYPNPFNPTTVISYSIPQQDYVTLKIFDLLGNEIQTLVDKYQTSGQHKIHFNGEKLASGVYVYCLITGNNFITSRKLLLLK